MKQNLFLKLLVLVTCLSSALRVAAYDLVIDGIYYNYVGQIGLEVTYKDTNYNSYSGNVTIPPMIYLSNGIMYHVTGIGDHAFYGCTNLISVNIPSAQLGYFSIGIHAFSWCTNLTSVTLPELTNVIDNSAFYNCSSLTSINIPFTVTKIGDYAFDGCRSLTNVVIPDMVTYLGTSAFGYCSSLTSIIIGTGVTAIKDQTFSHCSNLTNLTIGSNVTSIGKQAFANDTSMTEVVIPDKVTSIGESAFFRCKHITKMTIGKSVTSIGYQAFYLNGTYTVNGTSYLRQVDFHMRSINPPTIQSGTFVESNSNYLNPYYMYRIYTVNPYSRSLYKAANYWSNFYCLQNSSYDYMVEQPYDFYTGGIYYLITGSNTAKVTNKNGGTLSNDNITSYTGNVTIPNTAYDDYTAKTYNVTAIGTHAFDETRVMNLNSTGEAPSLRGTQGDLKSVTVGNNVTTIEEYAFTNATGMTSVTLGTGVTSIGAYAFKGCTSLYTVNSNRSTPPTIQSSTFDSDHYSTTKVYVPSTTAVNNYKAANYWKNFYLILPMNMTELDYALNVSGGNISFTSTGTYPWTVEGDGTRVFAQSGNAGVASTTSTMTASVSLSKASILTFDFKAWGEGTSYDKCIFLIDGVEQFSYGARDNDWETYSANIPAGSHTLTWTYSKDSSVNPTGDYFAVDNVKLTEITTQTGDVNGDGQVTIADVTELIDSLLSGLEVPTHVADVNGDGQVTIADVTELIDRLLSGN